MIEAHYERYQALKAAGRRAEAADALAAFIASFVDNAEKETWARAFLATHDGRGTIRHELYEQVIFPVLLAAYRQNDPWSLRWFAATSQNLYQAKHLWSQVDYKTDFAFLKDLVAIAPNDAQARSALLDRQIDWLRHCVHEWPVGILYGMDGANLSQCDEILAEIESTRNLDADQAYAEFLGDVEAKVREYKVRLMEARP